MNTKNESTGFLRFQLHIGRSPKIIPPLILPNNDDLDELKSPDALEFTEKMELATHEAKDALLMAKIQQSFHANKTRDTKEQYRVGEKVMLSTLHRRREHKNQDKNRVAKFMPRFDGPYLIIDANPTLSSYTLELPNNPGLFPTFHSSELKRCPENDASLFPSREDSRPGPVVTPSGEEE
jgi:hypothetical protein